jgi:hypothetical protein
MHLKYASQLIPHQLLYSYGIFAVEYIGFPIVGGKLSEVSRRAQSFEFQTKDTLGRLE